VRGTEIRGLAGPWLASWIDVRPSRFRIEASEYVLRDEWDAIDEVDAAVRALEPQIAIAGDVDQAFDRSAVSPEIDEDRRRDLVPVPRFIRRY
jgi:hypothetical protein